jgi:Zn-dependent peptidase ImmA (M78 family)
MKPLIKQLLREEIEAMPKKAIVKKFIDFVVDNLGIYGKVNVILTNKKDGITTTAVYQPYDSTIKIYIKNRAIVDVLRSLAHEMVHHKQNQRGELKNNPNAGDDGSPQENEANAKAGELIRIFGKQNPEIYNS